MNYKCVTVTGRGGPEYLQVTAAELMYPAAGQVRIKILAASVSQPDVTARYGQTPFAPKVPFVPGYAVVGVVDALGAGVTNAVVGDRVAVLCIFGGYAEFMLVDAKQLIPVPAGLDPAAAVPLILNYLVAYQSLHRLAHVQASDRVLIIGASGGIGTALLQLGNLAGLQMVAVASRSKHAVLAEYRALPVDYRSQDFVEVVRQAHPVGLDAVLDGVGGCLARAMSVLRRGGKYVGYANPLSSAGMLRLLARLAWFNLQPNGKTAAYYSTGTSQINRRPFLADWATLFRLLAEGNIRPIIAGKFPILEAARANALLESGQVTGNLVLVSPELL